MIDLHSVDLWQQAAVVINAVIAAVLGSLIGWERDRAGKSAGPRTMALVCASSATIVAIGAAVGAEAQFGDPTRAVSLALDLFLQTLVQVHLELVASQRQQQYSQLQPLELVWDWAFK